MAPSSPIVVIIAASIVFGAPRAFAAGATSPDWPCVQRKIATLTSAQMWDGAPVDQLTQWRDSEEMTKLIAVLASRRVPPGAMEVYVVGKRWMWKTQHMTGQREINELHVPIGIPVKLTMTSEDVIHSFFIPAFRVKQDAVPGRYTTAWFEATKAGEYHLFCAEYCGTKHSQMIGSIKVMEPGAFQTWLAGGTAGSPAQEGEKLFQSLACITCHRADSQGRGPRLEGLFGKTVRLTGGATVVADADYIRESILNPTAKVVDGYQPIMPTFQGLVSEEGVMQLIAYIQSLQQPGTETTVAPVAGGNKIQEGGASPAPRTP